ncbi:hypothetical protein EV44_g3229 [Erysiphe necator]|uniref:Uncharacterized protein n=1 Tax=Uncinula necator TaxID=52586 RepID=A0A0B1P1D6_UNCNE|nr:hypothetical protein EV44_g3229 [Erysiphe necator]
MCKALTEKFIMEITAMISAPEAENLDVKKNVENLHLGLHSTFMARNGKFIQNFNLSRSSIDSSPSQVQQTEGIKNRLCLPTRLPVSKNLKNFLQRLRLQLLEKF